MTPISSNETLLAELNPAQLQAVTAPNGNYLILAGAGSGKTRVLTHRIVWLISQGISPHGILAVTFTNKAATEMKHRLEKMLGLSLNRMWIGTFHGLAHQMLRIHWQEANLPQSFQIIDAEDQLRLLKRIHKTLNLNEEKFPAKQSQHFINAHKDKGQRPQHIKSDNFLDATLLKVYQNYEETCATGGLVDFAELLLRSYELLRQDEFILQHYKKRFQHILIDEFQDTNSIQYAWILLLAKNTGHLMVVGDDDQSIYSWRGANVENMQHLSHDFPDTKIIRLEQNYRSTGTILEAANAVIANNSNRLGKNLWTNGNNGEKITLYSAFNEIEEARYIISSIKNWHDMDDANNLGKTAILYRSNAQSRALEEQLIYAQIPYRIYGGLRFYERAEIKDTLAYLRLTINHNDDASFERIINTPTRGIGETTLLLLRAFARDKNISLWQAAQEMLATKQFTARAATTIGNFLQLIETAAQKTVDHEPYELINYLTKCSGLREHYAKEKTERSQARIENLDELINATRQFCIENKKIKTDDENSNLDLINTFLANATLDAGDISDATNPQDCVQLMTLHSAKGLEFPIVFLCGLEEGLFPHIMSMNEANGLEEERRLCYVGMTRARQKLFLLHAESRQLHGTTSFRRPSRFLREIPENLINKEGFYSTVSKPVTSSQNNYNINYSKPSFAKASEDGSNEFNLQLGQSVKHAKFGEGVITNFEGDGERLLVQVKFQQFGYKMLAAKIAKLEAI